MPPVRLALKAAPAVERGRGRSLVSASQDAAESDSALTFKPQRAVETQSKAKQSSEVFLV